MIPVAADDFEVKLNESKPIRGRRYNSYSLDIKFFVEKMTQKRK